MQKHKLSNKEKSLIIAQGGINFASIIEASFLVAKIFKENWEYSHQPEPWNENIDYHMHHDLNNFEPGYF